MLGVIDYGMGNLGSVEKKLKRINVPFIVSGEIENSGTSAWLVVPECEGMSVLTAWAAGKFSGASIGKFVKDVGLEEQVRTREIIIPGYVAQISGELEECLKGWEIAVGPQEAADLGPFMKMQVPAAV
jgi:acetyl-CoA decarbonylase/synthase complex subunit gamma